MKRVIKAVLERFLSSEKYNAKTSSKICKEIAQQLRFEIKELGFSRHKIVCQVLLSENKEQGLKVASRCLWGEGTDCFESATYSNTSLYAIAMVHGAYYD